MSTDRQGGADRSKEAEAYHRRQTTLPGLHQARSSQPHHHRSPYTGDRFERPAGLQQTVAGPMVMLNTIMAEALDHCATTLEEAVAAGTDFNEA